MHDPGRTESATETVDGGDIRYDYRTAHSRRGDPDYRVFIPETCSRCWEQAQVAEEVGAAIPTAPDEEVMYDDI